MLVELGLVEQRCKAVLEVLNGATVRRSSWRLVLSQIQSIRDHPSFLERGD
jgi:hypothetical protein